MSVQHDLAELVGNWKGANRLHLPRMPEPVKESESTMTIALKASGQFINFEYKWIFDGKGQEGLILLGCDSKSDAVQAIWTDSWHMSHKFMICDGTIDESGKIDATGSYAVEGHADWGWRIEILPKGQDCKIVMYNVSPEGDEELAVEAEYSKI